MDGMRRLTTNAWSSFGNVLYCECDDGYMIVYMPQNLPNSTSKLIIIININYTSIKLILKERAIKEDIRYTRDVSDHKYLSHIIMRSQWSNICKAH